MSNGSGIERNAMQFVSDLGDAVRRNPVSSALIGMGLIWLFAGGKASQKTSQFVNRTGLDRIPDAAADAVSAGRAALRDGVDSLGERFAGVGDSAASLAGTAGRVVRDSGAAALERASQLGSGVADTATEFGRAIPEKSSDLLSTARASLATLFNEQPLMLGAVGIAIGAGIAASLPSTDIEADVFGETSDDLKARAMDYAQQQAEHVKIVAAVTVAAVSDEAERQGLTPDGLKAAASDLGDRVRRVAESAGGRVG